jgi:hypothetical protein
MTTPVTIDFGDGKLRRLRYSVAATKRLHEQFGGIDKMLQLPACMFIPILLEGIHPEDKAGLTVESLEETVEMPQMAELYDAFFLAFTGKSLKKMIEEGKEKNALSSQTPTTLTIQ